MCHVFFSFNDNWQNVGVPIPEIISYKDATTPETDTRNIPENRYVVTRQCSRGVGVGVAACVTIDLRLKPSSSISAIFSRHRGDLDRVDV